MSKLQNRYPKTWLRQLTDKKEGNSWGADSTIMSHYANTNSETD